jgi:hypothetical protein
MPEKETLRRARKDAAEGKSPSTQAGEFVRQEIDHIRHGKHGARSTKQAIAIGLSEARRAGVKLAPPGRGSTSATRRKAKQDVQRPKGRPSAKRSRAAEKRLKREPRSTASKGALSQQARSAARRRPKSSRSAAARKAARTRKAERS